MVSVGTTYFSKFIDLLGHQFIEKNGPPGWYFKMNDEASYICDSCGEEIVIPIDFSAGSRQSYVEDCPVCCHPNVIHVELGDDQVNSWGEAE